MSRISNPAQYAAVALSQAMSVIHAWIDAGMPEDTRAFGQRQSPCGGGTFLAIAENAQTMADELARDARPWINDLPVEYETLLDVVFSALDCAL